MASTVELKEYIYENEKIEYILESLGCHNIKFNKDKNYYSAAQPDGDNPQGINIRNNKYLNYRSFSRNVNYEDNEDIISLVEYIKKYSFIESIKYLHSILGLEYKWTKKEQKKKEEKPDPLNVFKKIRSKTNRKVIDVSDVEFETLDENVLNEYVPMLHIDFLREGIMPWTREKFGLCYSYKNNRVIIPMRAWNTGELLGTNARTTIKNYEEFGIKKYFITPSYPKHLNLYGLYENYESIKKAGYVVIAESEKSVLKRDSLCDGTVVALSGKSISLEQVRILIGLNVEIIIGLDADVDINEIRHICDKFYHIRTVSYIYDKWNLLSEKNAPMDASNKIYQFLFKHRIKYDEVERHLYLKSLEK